MFPLWARQPVAIRGKTIRRTGTRSRRRPLSHRRKSRAERREWCFIMIRPYNLMWTKKAEIWGGYKVSPCSRAMGGETEALGLWLDLQDSS